MPTVLAGAVDTSTILAAEKPVSMDEEIKNLEPELTQFTTMLMKLSSKEVGRERIDWLEDQLMPRLVTLAASATSAATTLTLSTGESATINVNDLLRNQLTGEMTRVTAISATGDIVTVTRAIGGVAAASSVSGAQQLIVGNAYEQGATTGSSKVVQRTNQYNYSQIFRHSLSFTNTQGKIDLYGGRYEVKEQAKKLVEHKRAIEYALFWGARSSTAGTTHPIQTMGGAVEYISTNTDNESGSTLTASEFDLQLINMLQFCKDPVLFASPVVAYNISQFAATAYRTNNTGSQKYGVKIDAFVSGAYGFEVPVVVKRDWNDFNVPTGAATWGYGGWAFLIDMSRVSLKPLRDRSTKLYPNRQNPGEDIQTQEFLTETSFQFEVEKAHGYFKGISKT
jgi:hypothetical protein